MFLCYLLISLCLFQSIAPFKFIKCDVRRIIYVVANSDNVMEEALSEFQNHHIPDDRMEVDDNCKHPTRIGKLVVRNHGVGINLSSEDGIDIPGRISRMDATYDDDKLFHFMNCNIDAIVTDLRKRRD